VNRPYTPEEIEKILNDLYLMMIECKLFYDAYKPCPDNVVVQLFELNERMKIINAEMEQMKEIVLPK
jgi:hypothetical protein